MELLSYERANHTPNLLIISYHFLYKKQGQHRTNTSADCVVASFVSFVLPFGGQKLSRSAAPPYPTKPADAGLWRGPQDLFRQKYVCKTLKYTKYSCGFTPFSDAKSLVRLSWRFVRYCPRIIYMGRAETEYLIILLTSGKIKDTPNEGMDGNDIGVERRKHQSGDGML